VSTVYSFVYRRQLLLPLSMQARTLPFNTSSPMTRHAAVRIDLWNGSDILLRVEIVGRWRRWWVTCERRQSIWYISRYLDEVIPFRNGRLLPYIQASAVPGDITHSDNCLSPLLRSETFDSQHQASQVEALYIDPICIVRTAACKPGYLKR